MVRSTAPAGGTRRGATFGCSLARLDRMMADTSLFPRARPRLSASNWRGVSMESRKLSGRFYRWMGLMFVLGTFIGAVWGAIELAHLATR